eukprot:GHVU01056447.1.p1 GENE.GHVU01056447.1~~GHVU01056447.1.p1  ORF type:complete len:165 (+),score=2.50 GHVU01056447.1:665-1159(+)
MTRPGRVAVPVEAGAGGKGAGEPVGEAGLPHIRSNAVVATTVHVCESASLGGGGAGREPPTRVVRLHRRLSRPYPPMVMSRVLPWQMWPRTSLRCESCIILSTSYDYADGVFTRYVHVVLTFVDCVLRVWRRKKYRRRRQTRKASPVVMPPAILIAAAIIRVAV